MEHELDFLLELLDDENEQSASMAMAELLSGSHEKLGSRLRVLQESDDPRLRRRVHQLESAIRMRRMRRIVATEFKNDSIGLLEGLIQIHLLWFDNDTHDSVRRQWDELFNDFKNSASKSLKKIGFFMRKKGFYVPPREQMEAEYLCLGTVLEDFIGVDIVLTLIAGIMGSECGMRLGIIRERSGFALVDENGNMLIPAHDWEYVENTSNNFWSCHWYDTKMVLKFIRAMLFSTAVSTDGFRYIYTIGSCIAPNKKDKLDFLPYPYDTGAQRDGK